MTSKFFSRSTTNAAPEIPLWEFPLYADLLEEVDPRTDREFFRERNVGYDGDDSFWRKPSPEPTLPGGISKMLADADFDPALTYAAVKLARRIKLAYEGKSIVLVAILRAGVPVASWLSKLIPGSAACATSLFVGPGIDKVSLRKIRSDYKGREIVFVDGWTGKGGVARQISEEGFGKLAVLVDPWLCADFRGTRRDVLSPSAFFTGPTTLGFSRTFLSEEDDERPYAAYRFPESLLRSDFVENWHRQLDLIDNEAGSEAGNESEDMGGRIEHHTPWRLHSNEVGRAMINSNPSRVFFADDRDVAEREFGPLVEFADLIGVPQDYGSHKLRQLNARVGCSLDLK